MSNIKALDKLRRAVNKGKAVAFPSGEAYYDAIDECMDAIEREIAEHYMKLPIDADGVPIHVGDVVAAQDEQPFEVRAFQYDVLGWFAIERLGSQWNVSQLHRYKPRTLEDVLRECCNEWNEHCGDDWESGVYAKYAEEIRGMMA